MNKGPSSNFVRHRLASESLLACRRVANRVHADPGDGVSFVYIRIFGRLKNARFRSSDALERYIRRSAKLEAIRYYRRRNQWWSKENNYADAQN